MAWARRHRWWLAVLAVVVGAYLLDHLYSPEPVFTDASGHHLPKSAPR